MLAAEQSTDACLAERKENEQARARAHALQAESCICRPHPREASTNQLNQKVKHNELLFHVIVGLLNLPNVTSS